MKDEYIFKKILWRIHPNLPRYETRWFLFISDILHFMDFMDYRSKQLMISYLNIKKRNYTGHYRTDDEYAVGMTLELSKEKRESITDDVRIINDKLLQSYHHFYSREGYLFINRNGAIIPIRNYKVLEERRVRSFAWPEQKLTKKDIKITRWPGGKHYYAKIDTLEVKDEAGKIKWNTKAEAQRQAEKYLERMK